MSVSILFCGVIFYGNLFGLEIGKRSIMTHQSSLNITGHNIANANTEGYTRQVPI
jgi:flagellar hook-associated protein 1 FlgK